MIIGQDPYHGPGQAHGLCFSVQNGVPPPPSLINIFKELQDDIGMKIPSWQPDQMGQHGVFLLNASLTVRARRADESFKNRLGQIYRYRHQKNIRSKEHVVFLLWGKFAQDKKVLIDETKHLILKSAHPSPLSVCCFFGCKHFSKANAYLSK